MTALASFAFGPFLLLPGQQLLLDNREPVRIGRRALDLLTVLVRRHGELVSKEELLAEAWPGLRVEEGNLKVNIAALRRVLGEAAGPPRYIATVVGRGYRFVAPVRTPQAPGPARDILGRDEMIASVVRDLERARLVTIVGPGGVGKTRVAVAVAAALGGKLVDLTGEHHASRIPVAVESVRETSNEKNLLVLDGCEHLVGAVASHADHVLASTRTVTLLATSREPLCIRGERVRRLGALGLPPRSERLSACEALAFPAVQLFVERAIEACGTFGLDDTNATGVAEICHRLDGLPLAIERVAAHVGAWGVAGTLERIDRRSHLSECALTATVVLAIVAIAMLRFSSYLPVGKFFAYSSFLMAILAVVLLNATMGYLQESRAEAAIAALEAMSAAEATVTRDGERRRVPAAVVGPNAVGVVGVEMGAVLVDPLGVVRGEDAAAGPKQGA